MQADANTELTEDERAYFERELSLHEAKYLAGTNPRQQSGFGRSAEDWRQYREIVLAPVQKSGTFLDVGCANGHLLESAVRWAAEYGHRLEPYGLDISSRLVELAKQQLPQWQDRFFVGNALDWEPPFAFDYVRTELVYVPPSRRRELVARLLSRVVAPDGRLIIACYGSSRPEGPRAEALIDEVAAWGFPIDRVYDTRSEAHGFVVTRVVALKAASA